MDERLAGGGPALFQVVRYFSRRPEAVEDVTVREAQVLETVDLLARDGGEVTVADVAAQLGLDQSGASRFIASCITSGRLERVASDTDARRACVQVTEAGAALITTAHAWQEEQYRALLINWPREEAEAFTAGLTRLAGQIARR